MPTFEVMTLLQADVHTVEAHTYGENGSLVIFTSPSNERIFALPTAQVRWIRRTSD